MMGSAERPGRPGRGHLLSRGVAAGLDVGLSSLSNLVVGIAAARTLSLSEFGAYSTAFLVGTILIGLVKSLTTDPLVLNFAASEHDAQHKAASASLSASLVLGIALAPLVALLTWAVLSLAGTDQPQAVGVAAAAALICPPLALQETARGVAYCQGQLGPAVVNNLARFIALPVVVAGVLPLMGARPESFLVAWGVSALIGYLAGWWLLARPRLAGGVVWIRDNWRLGRALVADFGLTLSSAQGALLLISSIAGAEAIGAVRKTQLVLAPVNLLTTGALTLLQPVWVRRVAGGAGGKFLLRASYLTLLGIGVLTVLWVGLVLFLPPDLAMAILGDGWAEARSLMAVSTVYALLGAAGGLLGISLRSVGVVRQQVRWRVYLAPPTLIAVGLLSIVGPQAALIGLCASLVAVVVIWHILLVRASAPETQSGAS